MKNPEIIKYGLIVIGIVLFVAGLAGKSRDMPMFLSLGIVFIAIGAFTSVKSVISDNISSKAQSDLLKLKALLDQGAITQEEYDSKSSELKEKI